MKRKRQPGPSLFDALPLVVPAVELSRQIAPMVEANLRAAAEADALVAASLPAGPPADRTAVREERLAGYARQESCTPVDVQEREHIASWRARQQTGDTAPTWGRWWEGKLGDVEVLYRPGGHRAGADAICLYGLPTPMAFYIESARDPKDGTTLAAKVAEVLAVALELAKKQAKKKGRKHAQG